MDVPVAAMYTASAGLPAASCRAANVALWPTGGGIFPLLSFFFPGGMRRRDSIGAVCVISPIWDTYVILPNRVLGLSNYQHGDQIGCRITNTVTR